MIRKSLLLILAITLLLMLTIAPALAQQGVPGQTSNNVNLRAGAGQSNPAITTLPFGTNLVLEARNDANSWLLVHTADGSARGWASASYVTFGFGYSIDMLPVSSEIIGQAAQEQAPAQPEQPAEQPAPPVIEGVSGDLVAQLSAVPVVPSATARSREIFAAGQRMGNNAHVVAKVGDCNTENVAFLRPLDTGNYSLGQYGYLAATINFFSGSFSRESVAGRTGYSALTVLDATWADPRQCKAGDSSLWCEYTLIKPSVALIMFGSNDIFTLTVEQYSHALRTIVEYSINGGVIPVLSTFPNQPSDTLLQLNIATVNIARQYDVPVMNLWLPAQSLPNWGMASDMAHLTYSGSATVSFNGEETQYGFSLRNLVVLQTLDALRTGIPME